MLLSRPPLSPPRRTGTVRLACFRHAASVYPEPGSNSPSELSESPILHPLRLQMACSSDDLSTDRHAPHHSSIVNVPQAPSCWFVHHHSSAEGHLTYRAPCLSSPWPHLAEISSAVLLIAAAISRRQSSLGPVQGARTVCARPGAPRHTLQASARSQIGATTPSDKV